MKTIKNIDEKPNLLEVNLSDDVLAKIPTFRQYLKILISNMAGKSSDESLDLYQAGLKLMVEGADYSVEDSQFRILQAKVNENPLQWPVVIHAQLIQKFKQAEANNLNVI